MLPKKSKRTWYVFVILVDFGRVGFAALHTTGHARRQFLETRQTIGTELVQDAWQHFCDFCSEKKVLCLYKRKQKNTIKYWLNIIEMIMKWGAITMFVFNFKVNLDYESNRLWIESWPYIMRSQGYTLTKIVILASLAPSKWYWRSISNATKKCIFAEMRRPRVFMFMRRGAIIFEGCAPFNLIEGLRGFVSTYFSQIYLKIM